MAFDLDIYRKQLFAWDEENAHLDVMTRDSMILEKMLLEVPVTPCDDQRFFYNDFGSFDKRYGDGDGCVMRELVRLRLKSLRPEMETYAGEEILAGAARRAFSGDPDFGHTAPDFENVLSLGLVGLIERLEKGLENAKTAEQKRFFETGLRVWRAAISYAERAAKIANQEQSEALLALTKNPPATLYQAVQLTILYYMLQHWFEGTAVRTLGRLDALYAPFLAADIAAGRITDGDALTMMTQLMEQLDGWHIRANIPFAIGGTGENGRCAVNTMTYIILKAYAALKPPFVKLHFLYTEDTPVDLIEMAMDAIRNGANSICFMGDQTVTRSLMKLGETAEEARNYAVVGCYECGGKGEVTCSCNARVNMPKAIEAVFGHGKDLADGSPIGVNTCDIPETYEEFLNAFYRQLSYLCDGAIRITDGYEALYSRLHSAPFFSATYDACVENGRDIYCEGGAKYCNSSVNAMGIATVADSLYAVKKLVYEDREVTFSELAEILRSDWEGHEALRLRIRNQFPKYGTGVSEIDETAAEIVEFMSGQINGRKNVKGGQYRLGTFSIDWRHMFGAKTAATPDGRRSGETISQNSSASFGADKKGITAQILSVTRQDHSLTPNGSVLDVDLHSSAVRGEDGLAAMVATLRTYMKKGGFAAHYNVLNADVLRHAIEHPEDHPNLQVRLCGWNALFSNLKKVEQEEFITRSENE